MATSSMTKRFVLTGDKACEKLAQVLENPAPKRKEVTLTYERGVDALAKRWSGLKN